MKWNVTITYETVIEAETEKEALDIADSMITFYVDNPQTDERVHPRFEIEKPWNWRDYIDQDDVVA